MGIENLLIKRDLVEVKDSTEEKEQISIKAKLLRELIARFSSLNTVGKKLRNEEYRKNVSEPAWHVPVDYTLTPIEMPNFNMELLEYKENTRNLAILQFHGGGYVGMLVNSHRSTGLLYSKAGRGASVLTVDYRVAPENPYPCALEDGVAAYQWLLEQGFSGDRIIIAGDSAGGGLAMAVCMYIKDHNMPLPCGLVAMSPWTDLTCSGESYDYNYELDPLFGNTRDSVIYNNDYATLEEKKNPYVSPLFGDFTGFPPMLIQVGTYEMLLSDSINVAIKANEQGVKVRLSQYEGMFHVFQRAMLLMKESRKAWIEVEKFIDILLPTTIEDDNLSS